MTEGAVLAVTGHPGDFVWRASGALALARSRGQRAVIACLTFGERGESARLWREGRALDEIKAIRRDEAERAAAAIDAEVRFLDAGDYPLEESPELVQRLVDIYREVQPAIVLTHTERDPYNGDHETASALARKARILAQAPGISGVEKALGAPPVFYFEPHQSEVSGFHPDVLLDITPVWEAKVRAMNVLSAQQHLIEYYTELGKRRGVQAKRNSGPNLGLPVDTVAEAYQRVFPQVTTELD